MLLEIGSRGKRRAGGRARHSVARRRFEAGAGPDRWGKWKAERVTEVRRLRVSGRLGGRGREQARLRWFGRDPGTGLPWPLEWMDLFDANRGTLS